MEQEVYRIIESKFFDYDWYTTSIGKNKEYWSKEDAAEHYLKKGWKMGFDPSEKFSTKEYLMINPDVKRAEENPLHHYERVKSREKRMFKIGENTLKRLGGEYPGLICSNIGIAGKGKLEIETPVRIKTSTFGITNTMKIGAFSYIERNCIFNNVETIGRMCYIASGTVVWNGNQGINTLSINPIFTGGISDFLQYTILEQEDLKRNLLGIKDSIKKENKIRIGNDVRIGNGAKIAMGVTIGDGAIIGPGTVITKDVPPYAVVMGNPGEVVKYRFQDFTIKKLLKIRWWEYGPNILSGVDYSNIEETIKIVEERIENGFQKYRTPVFETDKTLQMRRIL